MRRTSVSCTDTNRLIRFAHNYMRVHGDKRTLGEVWDEEVERRHQMNDIRQFLTLFGESVARYLSADRSWWQVDRVDDTHIRLRGPDGMKISLWCGGISFMLQDGNENQIRFKVKGDYPPDVTVLPEDQPEINVGYSKGAKAVANDIHRRFLSQYVPLYYKKLEMQRAIEDGRAARERVMATLQEALDWREVRDCDGHLVRLETGYSSSLPYTGKLGAHYTSFIQADAQQREQRWEVNIELKGLTIDLALRIAEALREPRFPPEQMRLL